MPVRADLTIAVDVATRTICAAVLRPVGTKAVDAALLLAQDAGARADAAGLVGGAADVGVAAAARAAARHRRADGAGRGPAGDRPGHDRHRPRPGVRLRDLHPRLRTAGDLDAAGPASAPRRTRRSSRRRSASINTLFCQHVAGYTGSNTTLPRRASRRPAVWTLPELQDLLDEWLIAGWQHRPHDALRDPLLPAADAVAERDVRRAGRRGRLSAVTLTGEDYLELLPVEWRAINDYGIRIDYRTYDCAELGPLAARSTPASPPSAGSGRSTTTPTTCPRCSSAPRTDGSPSRGRTCRWSPRRSPTSPGATPAAWPPRQGRDDTNETEIARPRRPADAAPSTARRR